MTTELSLPIFTDGSELPAEFKLNGKSRYSITAGKINHESSEVKINPAGSAVCSVSEFRINLENHTMTTENTNVAASTDSNDSITVKDHSAKQACTRFIDFAELYRSDNVRGRLVTRIPEMVASLRENGFKSNHPLVVSKKPDGRFLVLVGNRRAEALEYIQNNHEDEFGRVLPKGRVPCIVHDGLTAEEEILIRNDHSESEDRVGLDDWSRFLAIRQLMRAFPGESETRIAQKMGLFVKKGKKAGEPNRSYVQPRVNLARLPNFVAEQFRLLWEEGKDATPVRIADIKPLYAVYNEEYGKHEDADSYNGEFGIGPKFRAKWEEIVNPAPSADGSASDGDADSDKPADLSAKAAKTRAMGCNSRLVKRILLAVTNQGGTLPDLDGLAAQFETDSQILTDIREYLGGDDYADLVNRARQARLDRESAQAEQSAEAEETADAS